VKFNIKKTILDTSLKAGVLTDKGFTGDYFICNNETYHKNEIIPIAISLEEITLIEDPLSYKYRFVDQEECNNYLSGYENYIINLKKIECNTPLQIILLYKLINGINHIDENEIEIKRYYKNNNFDWSTSIPPEQFNNCITSKEIAIPKIISAEMNNNLEFENEDPSPDNIEDNHPRTNYGKNKQIKCYCGHTKICDCGEQPENDIWDELETKLSEYNESDLNIPQSIREYYKISKK